MNDKMDFPETVKTMNRFGDENPDMGIAERKEIVAHTCNDCGFDRMKTHTFGDKFAADDSSHTDAKCLLCGAFVSGTKSFGSGRVGRSGENF